MVTREAALAGPKALKAPGSPEWCWQTVQVLREQMRHVAEQWSLAETALTELERVKAWEKIPPDKPYGSLDAMVRAEVGMPVKTLRSKIADARQRATDRANAVGKVREAKGGPVSKEDRKANVDIINVSGTGGTGADYLTRRIARDHPEIFERMKAGGYPSARAAALEAGIVKRTVTVRVDPEAAARILRKHFTRDQLSELARLLAEEE